jgi:hypothetical protein
VEVEEVLLQQVLMDNLVLLLGMAVEAQELQHQFQDHQQLMLEVEEVDQELDLLVLQVLVEQVV